MNITALEISQVRYLVIHRRITSISYVQRRLMIGYNKARVLFGLIKISQKKDKHKRFINKTKQLKKGTRLWQQ